MKVYIVVRIQEDYSRIQVSPKYSNEMMAKDTLKFYQTKHPEKVFVIVEQTLDFGPRPKMTQ
jgi:hypothetical protein